MTYLRNLWRGLMGYDLTPGWVVVSRDTYEALHAQLAAQEARIAKFERRSAGQRRAIADRKAKAATNGVTE